MVNVMADTSERIISLSFIILMFIAIQSTGTPESTRLEIITDKQEYAIGEKVKSTFYIYNPNPVPIKVEPYNIFEVDVFLNDIPQDGAFTADTLWESGAMITIPAESRHKIDDMTFVANEAGNFTINLSIRVRNDFAGGARHTVLILEPEEGATGNSVEVYIEEANYTVSGQEAVDNVLKLSGYEVGYRIRAVTSSSGEMENGTVINEMVWLVGIYVTPPDRMVGTILHGIVDVHTGKVYEVSFIAWISTPAG